jgi:hypothetical protein
VLQPVIQVGTAVHGKDLSGGALNRAQKPLRVQKSPLRPEKRVENVLLSVWILAKGAQGTGVAAVTERRESLPVEPVYSFDS